MTTSDIQLCTLYTQSYLFKMKNVTMSPSCLSTLGTTHCFRINFEIRTAADKTLHGLTSYRSCSSHKALLPSAPQSIAPWHLKAPCSLLPWPLPIPGTFSPAFQTPLPALAPYSRSGFRLMHHFLGTAAHTCYCIVAHSEAAAHLCSRPRITVSLHIYFVTNLFQAPERLRSPCGRGFQLGFFFSLPFKIQ